MQLEDRSECATDLALDEWFACESTPARRSVLEQHLRSCTRCRVRAELFERERAAFLKKAPTLADNAECARRLRHGERDLRGTGRRTLLAAAAATALVAGLVLLRAVDPPWPLSAGAATESGERRKGALRLGFYVKRGELVRRGSPGQTVYPGDRLRFTYSNDGPAYLALLGRDAHGATVYFPEGDSAARVAGGVENALDFSLELDAQLGVERLIAVSCPTSFALAPLREALTAGVELEAPPGCWVERVVLNKQALP